MDVTVGDCRSGHRGADIHGMQSTVVPSEAGAKDRPRLPDAAPRGLAVDRISLESIVHHRESVDSGRPLEEVDRIFREKQVDYLAILRGDRVVGICARVRLGALLGSRYGFAL